MSTPSASSPGPLRRAVALGAAAFLGAALLIALPYLTWSSQTGTPSAPAKYEIGSPPPSPRHAPCPDAAPPIDAEKEVKAHA